MNHRISRRKKKEKKQLPRCFTLHDRGRTRKRDSSTSAPVNAAVIAEKGNFSQKKRTVVIGRPVLPRHLYNGASTQLDRVPSDSCTSLWRASSRKTGAASRDARQQVRNWYHCQVAGRLVPRVSYGTGNDSPVRVSCRAPSLPLIFSASSRYHTNL